MTGGSTMRNQHRFCDMNNIVRCVTQLLCWKRSSCHVRIHLHSDPRRAGEGEGAACVFGKQTCDRLRTVSSPLPHHTRQVRMASHAWSSTINQ